MATSLRSTSKNVISGVAFLASACWSQTASPSNAETGDMNTPITPVTSDNPESQDLAGPASPNRSSNDSLIASLSLTPQTIFILVITLLLALVVLCLVTAYCVKYRTRKREAERAKAELKKMDQGDLDSPSHHDGLPLYVRDIRAATLNPHEEHQKTDTINTGGTYDYAPTRKDFSDNADLYIPQYASTVEEIPPYDQLSHLQSHHRRAHQMQPIHDDQQYLHNDHRHEHDHRNVHRNDRHNDRKDRHHEHYSNHHRQNNDHPDSSRSPRHHKSYAQDHGPKRIVHEAGRNGKRPQKHVIRGKFAGGKSMLKSKGRNKYRQAVQEEEEQNYGYGYGPSHVHHQGTVMDDEDVIQYNVRDGFIR